MATTGDATFTGLSLDLRHLSNSTNGDVQIRCNRTASTWINGVNFNSENTGTFDATITLNKNGANQLDCGFAVITRW